MSRCRWCGANTTHLNTLDCSTSHAVNFRKNKRTKLWWNNELAKQRTTR